MSPSYTKRAPGRLASEVLASSSIDHLPVLINENGNRSAIPAHLDELWHYECIVSPRSLCTSTSSHATAARQLLASTGSSPTGSPFPAPVSSTSSNCSPVSRFSASSPQCGGKQAILQRVFNTFDENGDGSVSTQEICRMLEKLGLSTPQGSVQSLIPKGGSDKSQDYMLDEEEFQELYESSSCFTHINSVEQISEDGSDTISSCSSLPATSPTAGPCSTGDEEMERDLLAAFHVFDKDGNGFISAEELQSVLCSLGFAQARHLDACKAMIARVDENGDGQVDFFEFRRMFDDAHNSLPSFIESA